MKTRTKIKLVALGGLSMLALATVMPGQAAIDQVSDPDVAALMRARSPGERVGGAYANKPAMLPMARTASVRGPAARAIAAVAPRSAVPAAVAAPAMADPATAYYPMSAPTPIAVPVAAPAVLALAPTPTGISIGALLPIIPVIAVIGGGGGGGGGTPPITGAVPEPETWLMLIIGFGMIGSALRVRRRRTRGTAGTTQLAHVPANEAG